MPGAGPPLDRSPNFHLQMTLDVAVFASGILCQRCVFSPRALAPRCSFPCRFAVFIDRKSSRV